MGIFRKSPIRRVYPEGDSSVNLSVSLVKDNVVKGGSSVTFVRKAVQDVRELPDSMPTKDEFDLDEQLKAGIRPEAINVTGMLGSDGSFDVNSALNTLYSDSKVNVSIVNVSKDDSSKDDSSNVSVSE